MGFPFIEAPKKVINNMGIVGAGMMGMGIAQVVASSGLNVILVDISKDILEASIGRIKGRLEAQARKGIIKEEEITMILSRIKTTTDYNELREADFVLESVFEDLNLKKEVFSKLDKICRPEVILASNTSSLLITDIANATTRLDKVIGMHFFNPPFMMRLVEVVKTDYTPDETVDTVVSLAERLGKVPVVVKDGPGLVSTRMGLVFFAECVRIVEEGLASVKDIDTIAKLGYGHPMGPFETLDMIGGIKIFYDGLQYMYQETGNPAYAPPRLLRKLVKLGYFGRKVGSKGGWYDYFGIKKE